MTPDSTRARAGATAFTTTASMAAPDADILAAFARRDEAYRVYIEAVADEEGGEAYWKEIDRIEKFLEAADAQTPRGAELQLWAALTHLVNDPDQDERSYRADLPFFVDIKEDLEWPVRLVVSAIQSLRAMRGAA